MKKINFKKTVVGYATQEVDSYIERLEKKLSRTEEIVLELDEKIKEKNHLIFDLQNEIEFYRSKESSISKIMVRAEQIAEDLIQEGRERARKIQEEFTEYGDTVSSCVEQTEEKVERFYDDYQKLLHKYLTPIEENDVLPLFDKLDHTKNHLIEIKERLEESLAHCQEEKN